MAVFSTNTMAAGKEPPPQPPYEVDENHPLQLKTTPPRSYSEVLQNKCSTLKFKPAESAFAQPFKPFSVDPTTSLKGNNQSQSTVVFGDFESNNLCTLKPVMDYCGKRAIVFQKSDKQRLINKITHVLIGKFSHGKPKLSDIKEFLFYLKLKGSYNVSIFDSKHIYIEFELFEDFLKIWLEKLWIIKGFHMRVFKWSADFNPQQESPVAPVWIHLTGLPLYLFEKEALMSIANAVGNPLYISRNNLNRSNLSYASLCVELDVTKPLLDEVWIEFSKEKLDTNGQTKEKRDGFWQKVNYASIPSYCGFCFHIGHSWNSCKHRKGSSVQISGALSVDAQLSGSSEVAKECFNTSIGSDGPGRLAGALAARGAGKDVQQSGLGALDREGAGADVQPSGSGELPRTTPRSACTGGFAFALAARGADGTGEIAGDLAGFKQQFHHLTTVDNSHENNVTHQNLEGTHRHKLQEVEQHKNNNTTFIEEEVLVEDISLEEGEFVEANAYSNGRTLAQMDAAERVAIAGSDLFAKDSAETSAAAAADATPELWPCYRQPAKGMSSPAAGDQAAVFVSNLNEPLAVSVVEESPAVEVTGNVSDLMDKQTESVKGAAEGLTEYTLHRQMESLEAPAVSQVMSKQVLLDGVAEAANFSSILDGVNAAADSAVSKDATRLSAASKDATEELLREGKQGLDTKVNKADVSVSDELPEFSAVDEGQIAGAGPGGQEVQGKQLEYKESWADRVEKAEEEGVFLENTLPVVSQDEESEEDEINGTLADLHKQVMGLKSSKKGHLVEEEEKQKYKKQDIRITSQLSPSEVKDCAKKELAKVYSTPTSSLPSLTNLRIPDKDGNAVPIYEILEKSARVSELSKELLTFRNMNENLKGEHGLDVLKTTEYYDRFLTWYTISILQTLKDHSQTSFNQDSTTDKVTPPDQDVIKKGLALDDQEWTTPKRRGRDRNKKKK